MSKEQGPNGWPKPNLLKSTLEIIFATVFIPIVVVAITTFLFTSQLLAVTAADIENANPEGQTVEFWVQYSDERLDAMKARAERFEAETGIKVNITYKGHYGKVPDYSVVVPGSMPSKNNPDGPSLYCVVIVKKVDEKTRSKTSINDLLRD